LKLTLLPSFGLSRMPEEISPRSVVRVWSLGPLGVKNEIKVDDDQTIRSGHESCMNHEPLAGQMRPFVLEFLRLEDLR
jgi:hypothetical protein